MPASKSEQVLEALRAVLETVPGASVDRNSVLPEKVPAGGLIILRDGDPGEPEQALGGFGNAYYQHAVEIEVCIEEGDPTVHDLPRVMRLPGFWHQKGEPFLSKITHLSDRCPPRPIRSWLRSRRHQRRKRRSRLDPNHFYQDRHFRCPNIFKQGRAVAWRSDVSWRPEISGSRR